jgi:hypothetical protein
MDTAMSTPVSIKSFGDARDTFPFLTEEEAKYYIFAQSEWAPYITEDMVKQARAESDRMLTTIDHELREILRNRGNQRSNQVKWNLV